MALDTESEASAAEQMNSATQMAEYSLLNTEDFDNAAALIEDEFISAGIRLYFDDLLARHGLTGPQAVERANIERGFGRQILQGRRRTTRDNYIKLAIAMDLTRDEAQSMLKFIGTGPIYAMRKRDAAILFCMERAYGVMETQLFLERHGMTALGDPEEEKAAPPGTLPRHSTKTMEQYILAAQDFDRTAQEIGDSFLQDNIQNYFDRLMGLRGIKASQVLARAGINPNFGFQLLRGERRGQRDYYIRLAYGLGLDYADAQRMLTFMKLAPLYALMRRDAAVIFCMGKSYDLTMTQHFLREHDLPLIGGGSMPD